MRSILSFVKKVSMASAGAAFIALGIAGTAKAALLGPTSYLSFGDSPFADGSFVDFHLEDFEDGLLNTPGVTASAGSPLPPTGVTDSVDEDDGTIDGSGTGGNSFFFGGGSTGITFTFDDTVLGYFPDSAGIVWTDGAGLTSFEAFAPDGTSLGTIGPVSIADGSFSGTSAEDRFFGVEDLGPIGSIFISNTSAGVEVDHLQYGIKQIAPPQGIPEPTSTLSLILIGTLGTVSTLKRKLYSSKSREK